MQKIVDILLTLLNKDKLSVREIKEETKKS